MQRALSKLSFFYLSRSTDCVFKKNSENNTPPVKRDVKKAVFRKEIEKKIIMPALYFTPKFLEAASNILSITAKNTGYMMTPKKPKLDTASATKPTFALAVPSE